MPEIISKILTFVILSTITALSIAGLILFAEFVAIETQRIAKHQLFDEPDA